MTHDIKPPNTDDEKDRHRYYGENAQATNSNTAALERVFKVLGKIEDSLERQMHFQSKVATIASVVGVVWIGASGLFGWYAQRIVTANDTLVARVEKLEKTSEMYQIIFRPHESLPDTVQAMKNRVNALEDDLSEIKRGKK